MILCVCTKKNHKGERRFFGGGVQGTSPKIKFHLEIGSSKRKFRLAKGVITNSIQRPSSPSSGVGGWVGLVRKGGVPWLEVLTAVSSSLSSGISKTRYLVLC